MTQPSWTQRRLDLPLAPSLEGSVVLNHNEDSLLDELLDRAETLVLPLRGTDALIDADGRLALLPGALFRESQPSGDGAATDAAVRIYLGRVRPTEGVPGDAILVADGAGDVPVLAIVVSEQQAAAIEQYGHGGTWANLRLVGGRLDRRDAGLLTRAVALANWHQRYRFSPSSGNPTTSTRGGWVRVDPADGAEHFPRTDPAIIVAVTDGEDRLLLASNAAWESNRYSLIAGFVDPGESLEAAVLREVHEEAGLRVTDPVYLGSQPWPFPASLMVGFAARLVGDIADQAPDGIEIRALRWFTRDELWQAAESGDVLLPGPASIARSIVEAWYGEWMPFGR